MFSLYFGQSLWTELLVEVFLGPERILVIYGNCLHAYFVSSLLLIYRMPCSILLHKTQVILRIYKQFKIETLCMCAKRNHWSNKREEL